MSAATELVTLSIDGKEVSVPKGTNLIEAAKGAGIDIPHYCYHPDLSIAGNCRMCQVQVKGQPKMTIACNTTVAQGMEVSTNHTSKDVANAQAATLEFILINHPLDCTVCDQAGHCKLQDYHFEYNARSSRFLEEKQHKVKAIPLGPTVMLDGERCIMCTRCVRFCDEVTGTSEIGMLNRGDKSVIAVSPGHELNNPLSGSVVDLCPVGALTHKEWRFNTRIWFTKQVDSICPGCSTGCNVKVASRDGQIVQVKARYNAEVNKEWLCDEGRYGFSRFLPNSRVAECVKNGADGLGRAVSRAELLSSLLSKLPTSVVVLSPDLLMEEYLLLKILLDKVAPVVRVVMNYVERGLSEVEKVLVSPDYASNYMAAKFVGLVSGDLEANYKDALHQIANGSLKSVILIGDRSISGSQATVAVLDGLRRIPYSIGLLSDADSALIPNVGYLLGTRTILEKSGFVINRSGRIQYTDKVIDPFERAESEAKVLLDLCALAGVSGLPGNSGEISERELSIWALERDKRCKDLSIRKVKAGGVLLELQS